MAIQPFLIRCHQGCGARKIKVLVDQIVDWGGQVLLVTEEGRALVIHIDDTLRDAIAARPEVALIGGVQFQPRRMRRIRVDESGKHIATDLLLQGESHG